MKHFFIAALSCAILFSCKKDANNSFDNTTKAELSIEFDNIVGGSDLQLNTSTYSNSSGEAFKVSKLRYYVSNFILTGINGTLYTVPQDSCYFLIDESNITTRSAELKVPEGEYKTLQFTLGVDSLRNTKDISQRTGVLDPTATGADMYWGWNSGYIFFKLEGTSAASTAPGNMFMYHIGGFGGYSAPTINNLQKITLDLTARGTPKVKNGKETNVHLLVDIAKMFSGPTTVSINAHPTVMFENYSSSIAANLAAIFKHDHTEN